MSNIQAVWLRNDLRLDDHPALYEAQQQGPIHVVYVATPKQWQQHHESPARLGLKAAALQDIAERLAELGIPFTLLEVHWFKDVPAVLKKFCTDENISELWFQLETPWDENERDENVEATLKEADVVVHALPYDLLVPLPVKTQQ
ncbi:MAG: deoxyribodipyrimidine photo-lyase, partial [Methylophaga sp.]